MSITLDTNVLLSSAIWDGSIANRILNKLLDKGIKVYSSTSLIEEYKNVLVRDFGFSEDEAITMTKEVLVFLEILIPKIKIRIVEDDPDDNKVLECAVSSGSKYILTYDKHLLKIKEYEGIKILRHEDVWNELDKI